MGAPNVTSDGGGQVAPTYECLLVGSVVPEALAQVLQICRGAVGSEPLQFECLERVYTLSAVRAGHISGAELAQRSGAALQRGRRQPEDGRTCGFSKTVRTGRSPSNGSLW